MRYLLSITTLFFSLYFANGYAIAEELALWQFGSFNGSAAELTSADDLAPEVHLRVDSSGVGSGFPELHSPPDDDFNPDNANVINVTFFAEPGTYTLKVGQLRTYDAETVAVSLNGSAVGTYTTKTSGNVTHRMPLTIGNSGYHTITFEEFYGNDGYAFDAVAMVMDVTELTALPHSIFLMAPGDIGLFSVYGGIGDYRISTNRWIAETDLSSDGHTVYVRATGPGQTTITIEDQASNYVRITVEVGNNDSRTSTYDPEKNIITIPQIEASSDSYNGQITANPNEIQGFVYLFGGLLDRKNFPMGGFYYLIIENL